MIYVNNRIYLVSNTFQKIEGDGHTAWPTRSGTGISSSPTSHRGRAVQGARGFLILVLPFCPINSTRPSSSRGFSDLPLSTAFVTPQISFTNLKSRCCLVSLAMTETLGETRRPWSSWRPLSLKLNRWQSNDHHMDNICIHIVLM